MQEKVIVRTPIEDGFHMPAEWEPHSGCLISWPCKEDTWCGYYENAKRAYLEVVRAINQFEPVIVLADPAIAKEASNVVGKDVQVIEVPLDDSWIRDNGPIYLVKDDGIAITHFKFNGWGGRFLPYEKDAKAPELLASMFRIRRYIAPLVLEGGGICTDGEGTLLTTESCTLNPNRNPGMSKEEIEDILKSYLGGRKILWLRQGIHRSMIDGHIDGVAAFAKPGVVLHASCDDEKDPNYEIMRRNKELLETMTDARGHSIEIIDMPMPRLREIEGNRIAPCYTNFYIANSGIVAPIFGDKNDGLALQVLRETFPEREIVGVRCEYIGIGGGEVHCITQQIPRGSPVFP
ncbi:MAG: agmatine deiminase family protein [Thermoplasmata archaeon]